MARDEFWDALKEYAHRNHQERVSKNSDRIAYAIQQFEAVELLLLIQRRDLS